MQTILPGTRGAPMRGEASRIGGSVPTSIADGSASGSGCPDRSCRRPSASRTAGRSAPTGPTLKSITNVILPDAQHDSENGLSASSQRNSSFVEGRGGSLVGMHEQESGWRRESAEQQTQQPVNGGAPVSGGTT